MNRWSLTYLKDKTFLLILGVMIFTVLLSAGVLMQKSLRLDEAQSIWQTNHTLVGTLTVIGQDIHLPAYFVGLRFWEMGFGTSVRALRAFSLIFLLLSFPAIYYLGKEAYSKRIAHYIVLMTGASAFLQWFGSEARMYTLLFCLTTLNHLSFMRIWKREAPTNEDWLLYAVTAVLGAYTHYFFLLMLLVQGVFYLSHQSLFPFGSLKKFGIVALALAAEMGSWVIWRLHTGTSNAAPLLHQPTSADLFNLFSNDFIGLQANPLNTFFLSLWPLLVLFAFSLLAARRKISPETTYLLLASFVPIVLAFLISLIVRPLFVSRYLIVTLPSLYLLAAYSISLYGQKAANIIMAALIACMAFSLSVEAFSPLIPANENYREAAEYIASKAKGNDIFVVSAPFTTYPIEYYYRGTAPLSTFPLWQRYKDTKSIPPYSETALAESADIWSKTYATLYLLTSYDQGYEEKTRLYLDKRFERIETREFSPGLHLYVYKLQYS